MKRPGLFALAVLVILLLTSLLLNSLQPRTARLEAMERGLDTFENAQHLLRRDVISVRAGILQSFDPLVRDITALDAALKPLEATGDQDHDRLIQRLRASAARQAALTETLKSNSALLQNSLAYFSTLSANADRLANPNAEEARLSAAMLRLTLNTSPDTQALVDRRVRDLAARPTQSKVDREAREVLLSHARLLRRLLPQTDQDLAKLLAEDDNESRARLRAWIAQERSKAEQTAQRYRYALYAAALILTLLIADLALRLGAHLADLRRRAAFEHDLAAISAEIIAARPHEAKGRIDEGLARLAAHVEGDAAFLFGEGVYGCARMWPTMPRTQRGDWSTSAKALAEAAQASPHSVFNGYADWPWRDDSEQTARRAHVVAMAVSNERGERCVLGFARFRGAVQVRETDLGVMRLALDVLAGAVRRARLEQQRVALESRLQHAGRMEAIGAFASGIAHNFNNILSAIGGYAEMAAAREATARSRARYLREITGAVARARRLVDQILAYGARSPLPLQRVDLSRLVAESISLLRAAHGRRARFAFDQDGGDHSVLGDSEGLQQIVMNLASNAVQAMGGAGVVKISLYRRSNRAPVELSSGVLMAGDYVVLRVEDQGAGMSQATLARIFEPFFTTRAQGNGLGLATTAETARELGGAVSVWSEPGQGAVFEVWLPRQAQAPSPEALTCGRGETVLVIGPGNSALGRDEERLAALGYEPVGFVEPARALSALRDWPERFDAIAVRTEDEDVIVALRRANPDLGLVVIAEASGASVKPLRALAASLGNCSLAACPLSSADLAKLMIDAINRPRASAARQVGPSVSKPGSVEALGGRSA
ncbi:two-component sensor histidine kinase [Caulobacter segnis]|uniref:histidine kinase n=2 Tax=Caulobacter segnis TaxID=88688 RepID=D5VLY5_CAUST|nr:two-component system VirA-like sensor kinase [Caulobacter segnis]ADG11508.1 integral membrane sensor signal transduction histidine kinase [Caulobacter segnis ATCC 21756]AVQ03167.1 two-component sensor histidine kinase [Caulobacter segnis]